MLEEVDAVSIAIIDRHPARGVVPRLAALGMLASLLWGCASPPVGSPASQPASQAPSPAASASPSAAATFAPGEIEVASFYPEGNPDAEFFKVINEAFAAAYPGTTAKTWFFPDFGEAQDQRLRAGTPPDVIHFAYTPGTQTAGYARAKTGQLLDLDDAMAGPVPGYDGTWKDSIIPAALPFITFPETDSIIAVPREITIIHLFYNATMFRDLGIEPPATWIQLLAAGEALKAANIAPIAIAGTQNHFQQYWYEYLLLRLGGADAAQAAIDGEGSFADVPGAVEAGARIAELRDKGFFSKGFEGTDILPAQIEFFSGKAGMILIGSWLPSEMADQVPGDFELGRLPFPSLETAAGDDDDFFGFVNTMSVATDAKRPDLGTEWLRVFSGKDVQNQRIAATQYISASKEITPPEGYEQIVEDLNNAQLRVYNFGVFGSSPAAQVDAWAAQIVRLFRGELTPDAMVKEIDTKLKAFWASQ